jgi:hypothetical protein
LVQLPIKVVSRSPYGNALQVGDLAGEPDRFDRGHCDHGVPGWIDLNLPLVVLRVGIHLFVYAPAADSSASGTDPVVFR